MTPRKRIRLDTDLSQSSQDGRIHPPIDRVDIDYAAWFTHDASTAFTGFSAATTAMPGFQRPTTTKSLYVPSAAALHEAEERMRKWQDEPDQEPVHASQPASPQATFSSARNAFSSIHLPETPTPVPAFRSANAELTPTRHSPLHNTTRQTRSFKSPLIGSTTGHLQLSAPNISSPLHDHCSQAATAPSPLHPSPVVNHVTNQKPLGFTPIHGSASKRPKFITPFKVKSALDVSRASALENMRLRPTHSTFKTSGSRIYPPSIPCSPQRVKKNSHSKIFDLTSPSGRRTLATSGLRPQIHSAKQLEDMGIDFKTLSQVNLQTAPFYAFSTRSRSSSSPDSSPSLVLDRTAALAELQARGCKLAHETWLDNHWSLILWKLAGMVALDPTTERDSSKKRWCWAEVVRQLMYRYERDLNSSSRPPLRLITIRDASAESSMVLCISDIIWPTSNPEENNVQIQSYPELEVTDGWYRLRAHIDAPLARGIRKGKIKIGRKIAIASAKLSAERKEGSEILEAYNSSALLLTGNSTHMAPWHAKLGFQRGPFIATLNSLTPDGGNIAVMILTVIKAYPVAYIEFIEDAGGRKQREGPFDARQELELSAQWKTKRESHASRLWSEYEKRRYRLLDHAEHLEQRAGPKLRAMIDGDSQIDGPPDKIYDMYDDLREDPEAAKNIISSLSREDATWLAQHIRERVVQERDQVSKGIEQELESVCPPRDVKNFCVIVVNDTRTYKHPSELTAQVTVWDIPRASEPDCSNQNFFKSGQRYLVTNLVPTQPSAWMNRTSGGEVYLSTRKNSKWTLIN